MGIYVLAVGAGLVLQNALRVLNIERLMMPERYATPTWGLTLYATAWANAATVVAIAHEWLYGANGTDARQWVVVACQVLAGVCIAAWSWGGYLFVRQGRRNVGLDIEEFGSAERAESGRRERCRRWEADPLLRELFHVSVRLARHTRNLGTVTGGLTAATAFGTIAVHHGSGMLETELLQTLTKTMLWAAIATSIGVGWKVEHYMQPPKEDEPQEVTSER